MKMGGVHTHGVHKIALPKINDSFTLAIFGDVHYGCKMFCPRVWGEFKYWCKHVENPRYIGIGDYTDVLSTSERNALNRSEFHDQTLDMIEGKIHSITDDFSEEIEFMRDLILFIVEGNHYARIKAMLANGGMSIMESGRYLADKLGAAYAGCETLRRLHIDAGGCRTQLDVACFHGKAGGTTPGGSINPVKRMRETFRADVFIQGHDHSKGVWTGETTKLNAAGKLIHDTELYIRSGSFLKSRENGVSHYTVDAGLPPTSLGWVSVKCTAKRDSRKDGRGIWVKKEPTLH